MESEPKLNRATHFFKILTGSMVYQFCSHIQLEGGHFPNLVLILPVTTPPRSVEGETAVITVLILNVAEHNINVTKRQHVIT